jgi:hypothetical protein
MFLGDGKDPFLDLVGCRIGEHLWYGEMVYESLESLFLESPFILIELTSRYLLSPACLGYVLQFLGQL